MTPARRKTIPDRVKLIACLARFGLRIEQVAFDHEPPLALRDWDEDARDTRPAANDPLYIQMLVIEEHAVKTNGTKATTAGSDKHKIARLRRLTKDQEEHRRRMLTKGAGEDARPHKPRWPKRKFQTRRST